MMKRFRMDKLFKLITALFLVMIVGCGILPKTGTIIVRVGTDADGTEMCVQKSGTSTSSPFKCPS